jgi:beta-glucanase (GH16 family)
VSSHPGHSQKYGYFETSIRAQSGPMTWPAFWMLPRSGNIISWKPDNIRVRHLGVVQQQLQFETTIARAAMNNQSLPVPSTTNTEFHTYGLEWTRDRLQVYYDGVPKGWDTSGLIHIRCCHCESGLRSVE